MKTLRGRLWLGFGGLLLILVVVSALSVVVLTRYSRVLTQVFRENYDSAVYCDQMKDALDRTDAAAQRQVWGGAEAADTDIPAARNEFDQNLRKQLGNVTLSGERERTAELKIEWEQYQESLTRLASSPAPRRADIYRQELLPQFHQAKLTAQQVTDMNMANMVSVDGRARGALIGVRNVMLVLVSAGVLLAAVLVGAVGATIVRPLRSLSRSATEIGRGNLDMTLNVRAPTEIAQVADAFNVMARQLREFRRLDHEKLARTQQTTQLAIDSLPDAVFLIGPEGVVEMSNRTARDHFGIHPGSRVAELKLEWLTKLYATIRDDHQPFDPEGYGSAIQIFDGGRERFLLPRGVPVPAGDGTTIGITVVLVDVTRLRHADELKSGLLSTVSHELRTPLTSIRMALGLLTGEKLGGLTSPQKKLLAAARDDSDRLYRIIENLLNMTRIEAGRSNFAPQSVPATEVVGIALDPLRQGFADKGLALHVKVDRGLPDVWADPASIGYALTNLLGNALKFTPAPGDVSLSVSSEGDRLRFTVSDTGPGIPPEYAERVFDKFFRLPREKAVSGAGLGLTIAREIIEAHHGSIAFRPRNGGGSEFAFTLPAAQATDRFTVPTTTRLPNIGSRK
jgi:NtrC-family two-component system sensor histidine kinase KinB